MKAKITIGRTQSSHDNEEPIRISIIDESSGVNVMELSMSLSEFAECITGLGRTEATISHLVDAQGFSRIGKTLRVDTVFCPKVKSHDKEDQRTAIFSDYFENYRSQGWFIKSDGTTSQQNATQHAYIIARWY